MSFNLLPIFLLFSSIFIPSAISQAPAPAADSCNGIFLTYTFSQRTRIHPFLPDPDLQPYAFQSTATILNAGADDLKSWKLFVGFQHDEILVSANPAVLSDGSSFPASVGNGTSFSGFPNTDLKTAIETAGDLSQIQVQIQLVGTQFGVRSPAIPMPLNISLANDGYKCPSPRVEGVSSMFVCCTKDANFKVNITEEEFLPRLDGDLTIAYDVLQSYESNYLAQVTISNHNPLGRLDNWNLEWEWMRGEFINSMRGAYTTSVDPTDCIYGVQGTFYQALDFSKVMNCQKSPTILDLPLTKANDSAVGLIPFCCRNGTILPRSMDPSKSTSAFQLQVYKMPPDLNRTVLYAPQNWKISGTLNPDYQCGPPVRVSPTQFPDTSGLESTTSAIASWQVVCNITQPKGSSPRCCVSFSAFYNESVIPCQTCACGCPSNVSPACSSTAPALLLPSEALLVPFANRTVKALAWADLKHFTVPRPLPCGDNCGVSINWHIATDYNRGWSARITLFNWEDTSFADWFTAVQLDKAVAGYENMFSFNGSRLSDVNNTIFMQGNPGLNYLVAETDGANPSQDPRVPGKQQTVISFTKKSTPGIDVAGGDGFPSKVFFNGEECSLPSVLPTSWAYRAGINSFLWAILLALVVLVLEQ
ncbi:COBRA-like protein 7 [Magnolia sinica]|uniref:COBRA-like protein 7 n=1 Tax=Magnolia sinica TaxID=86752 RepID=UPI002659684B|nr:COBRA-like protein 7 [Magnolia sinica]